MGTIDGGVTDPSQLPSSIPAYLIEVIPELKLNGQVIKSGAPMKLGEELDFIFRVKTPLEKRAPYTYKVVAGSYLAIASIGQNVTTSRLQAVKSRLKNTQQILQSKDQTQIAALTREDILGNMFEAGVLGYFAEYNALGHIMAEQQRAGQSLAIGYGSYGYEPNVTVLFGIPTAITPGGAVMNIRIGNYVTTHTNDHQASVQFNEKLGALSSELEAAIPEQMFVSQDHPGEAVSAVKALAKAEQAGQRIYHITPANMAATLPHIHHSDLVMGEIRDALAAGKDVITHTEDVSVPGWSGAGYIIIDPHTGIGAYKIGGDKNGGFISFFVSKYGIWLSFLGLIVGLAGGTGFAFLLGLILLGLNFIAFLETSEGGGPCSGPGGLAIYSIGLALGALGLFVGEKNAIPFLYFGLISEGAAPKICK